MKTIKFCVAIITLCCLTAQKANAQKVELDGITYSISKNEAQVEKINPTLADVVIPETIERKGKTYPVTAIGKRMYYSHVPGIAYATSFGLVIAAANAVSNKQKRKKVALRTLSIPNSVRMIDKKAFAGCGQLYKITLPDTPIQIADDAFDDCILITEVITHSGEFPKYAVATLPAKCAYMLAQNPQPQVSDNQPVAQQTVAQSPAIATKPVAPLPMSPSSDVDKNIPVVTTVNENTFAVIIANENYQEEVKVDYALNDGEIMKQYCQKVLGLPEDNIHIRKDATLNNIKAEMAWIKKVAQAYNGDAHFIVFYAGHGIPDEKSGTSYLLPIDGKGTMLETGYSLQDLYEELGNIPSTGVVVFMDACFSGSKRGSGMLASARGVAIKAKPQAPKGKMVVFSAAQGDETAYPFKEKGHGLFTYYLLKKLKETSGNVSLGELGNYVTEQVSRKSIVVNGKSQTPSVSASASFDGKWEELKLK